MSCSFVIVDIRRHDSPIVYCSPTFSHLTGYSENEVLGKNCRFLQSPDGIVQKGETRRFTAPQAVTHLKKSLVADKECQTSIVNYKKGGVAFINLVTVIPVAGGVHNAPHEADDIVYHVGFQVDLTEAPNAILQKLRDGSYIVNYSSNNLIPPSVGTTRDRKNASSSPLISKQLRTLLADPSFIKSIPIHSSTTVTPSSSSSENAKSDSAENGNQTLNLILLEKSPDFILVVSLKGSFLYVAPSVRNILGYEPDALVGKSISEFCHPADVVPLMRELKESSATPGTVTNTDSTSSYAHQNPNAPKTVDLLFRARALNGLYIWIECRGRLHVEPGKGRKAIILSGRARGMPCTTTSPTNPPKPDPLTWSLVASTGGLTLPLRTPVMGLDGGRDYDDVKREFWGMFSRQGVFLVVGGGVADVLGWGVSDVVGRGLGTILVSASPPLSSGSASSTVQVEREVFALSVGERKEPLKMHAVMRRKDNVCINVELVLYPSGDAGQSGLEQPVVFQIRVVDPSAAAKAAGTLAHPAQASIFEELDTRRGSSWQYELQQLKFANQRLTEEIEALGGGGASSVAGLGSTGTPVSVPVDMHGMHRRLSVASLGPSPVASTGDWSGGMLPVSSMARQPYTGMSSSSSLKRSWHASGS